MSTPTPPSSLVAALRRVLYPLVRLMLARGITYTYLADLLKGVFVEVAEREFSIAGKAQTDSRISLLTGVHRKDVRRLRGLDESSREEVPPSVSLGAQLVAAWTGLPAYQDPSGGPRRLPRLARSGGDLSFEGLVASVSKDIRSRAVLDEWLRLGVVNLNENDEVVLDTAAFVPQRGFEEKAFYFAHNLHDHVAAAAHNLLGEGQPWLERSVHYDSLSADSIAKLREVATTTGMDMLLDLNRRAMVLEEQDSQAGHPRRRFTCGIYFFSEVSQQDAPAAGDNDDALLQS
jgi:hypothetical protein